MRIRAHGLTFDTDVPWHVGRTAPERSAPDVRVRLGKVRPISGTVPDGDLLCMLEIHGELSHCVVADDNGYLIRWSDCAEARIDPDMSLVEMSKAPDFDDDLMGVLATGMLTATLLQLRGHHVLHASAVELGGKVAAIFGPSGSGKSTVATLAARAGAPLVTDDVLRVDRGEGGPVAWIGATETRLRPKAASLTLGQSSRPTADERIAVSLPVSAHERLPLAALVVPHPDREKEVVSVVELGGLDGLMALVSAPRILGWCHQTALAAQLAMAGELAEQVPVVRLHVPWGPPFRSDLGSEIVDALKPYSAST